MPHQNRVTPFGEIIVTPARGTFMGNRGCLHNDQQQIVRPFQGRRWIICRLSFKDRQRTLLQPGRYTELFFLDEATALAAGHRPCFECRRRAFYAFQDAWAQAQPAAAAGKPKAATIDTLLHQERLDHNKQKVSFTATLADLPAGTFIVYRSRPYLLWQDALLPWSPTGYGQPQSRRGLDLVSVLTPRPTVAVLRQQYRPQVHETAVST